MEGLALTGAWVDREKGCSISFGNGNVRRFVSLLKNGEGSSGEGRPETDRIPTSEKVLLDVRAGSETRFFFRVAKAMRANGNK